MLPIKEPIKWDKSAIFMISKPISSSKSPIRFLLLSLIKHFSMRLLLIIKQKCNKQNNFALYLDIL